MELNKHIKCPIDYSPPLIYTLLSQHLTAVSHSAILAASASQAHALTVSWTSVKKKIARKFTSKIES